MKKRKRSKKARNRRDYDPAALGEWRATYVGDGVVTNRAGVFQNGTTAGVSESLAKTLVHDQKWVVLDPSGELASELPPVPVPAASAPALVAAALASTSTAPWRSPKRRRKSRCTPASIKRYREALLVAGVGAKLSLAAAAAMIDAAQEVGAKTCDPIMNGVFCSRSGLLLVLPDDKKALRRAADFLRHATRKRPTLKPISTKIASLAARHLA